MSVPLAARVDSIVCCCGERPADAGEATEKGEEPNRKRLRHLDVGMKEVEEGSLSVSRHLFVE